MSVDVGVMDKNKHRACGCGWPWVLPMSSTRIPQRTIFQFQVADFQTHANHHLSSPNLNYIFGIIPISIQIQIHHVNFHYLPPPLSLRHSSPLALPCIQKLFQFPLLKIAAKRHQFLYFDFTMLRNSEEEARVVVEEYRKTEQGEEKWKGGDMITYSKLRQSNQSHGVIREIEDEE